MVLVEFSIGVEEKHFEEVVDLLNKFDIKLAFASGQYTHALFGEESAVCINCISDKLDMKEFIDYLDTNVNYTVILTE